MNAAALIGIYVGMLVFDAAVLAGTVYLIGWKEWSPWWMVLAVFMCAGSNPRRLIAAWACNQGTTP